MLGSSTASGEPRLRASGAQKASADVSALRVLPTTEDPMDDVRVTLATLTARAQRMVSDADREPVLRTGHGLCEAARRGAEEARQRASRSQATGEGYAPATDASVELFMTHHLGFDMQAQQRLLQQMQRRQAQAGADLGPRAPAPVAEGSGFMGVDEVDAVVAEIRNEILLDVQNTVHRRQTMLVREQVDSLFKAAWHPHYVRLADDFEARALGVGEQPSPYIPGVAGSHALPPTHAAGGMGGPRSLPELLRGESPVAAELNSRIAAFAKVVEEHAPLQWVRHFTARITESSVHAADEVAALWATVAHILEPLQRRGAEADALSYVAASCHVMERKSLSQLLQHVHRLDPMRFEEVENMNAAHVLDAVTRYCGTPNPWMHTFVAMRAGRYDVAVLAAKATGQALVADALQQLAAAAPMARRAVPPMMALQTVYAEAHTKADAYRQAVLLLLLAGRTGEQPAEVVSIVLGLSKAIARNLEDALWLRMACVRGVEESTQVPAVQSLRTLQRAVLDDMQDLLAVTQGNACRLAAFLLHAMLPCSALRLLLENAPTHVDGFHIALCFNVQNLLPGGGQQAAVETPIDLAQHMTRYASLVLFNTDRNQRAASMAGTAVFAYFHKNGLDEAFVECCLKDSICARLLGSRPAVGGRDALLLRGAANPLADDLLKALLKVAEVASERCEAAKATHVLLAVTLLASQLQRTEVQQRALRRAVQIMSSAMAQVLYLSPSSSAVTEVLSQAAELRGAVERDAEHLDCEGPAAHDYHNFSLLCRMADIYMDGSNGNYEHAVATFLQLPFVPSLDATAMGDIEACVVAYCNAPDCVQLGASAIVPIVMVVAGQLMQAYARSRASGWDVEEKQLSLLRRMRSVCDWSRQCCARTGTAYPTAAVEFENTFF